MLATIRPGSVLRNAKKNGMKITKSPQLYIFIGKSANNAEKNFTVLVKDKNIAV